MRKNITFVVIITLLVGMGIGMAWSVGQAALTLNADSVVADGDVSVNGVAASAIAIGTSTTSGTVIIGGEAQTGALTVGQSSGINTVNIGTGAGATTVNIATGVTNAKVVKVGTGLVANGVIIGTRTGAASTTIKAGTGQIVFMGQLVTQATSGLIAYPGTATTSATSNDTAGTVTAQASAHTYTGVGFAATYGTAPRCIAFPGDVVTAAFATTTYVGTTATSVTIYHATSGEALVFNYFCVGTE